MADPIKQPAKAADSPEEVGFIAAFKRLLKKHENTEDDAQNHALGGLTRQKTVMDAVDEAVTGAPKKPEDF